MLAAAERERARAGLGGLANSRAGAVLAQAREPAQRIETVTAVFALTL